MSRLLTLLPLALALALAVISCNQPAASTDDAKFESLAGNFIAQYTRLQPEDATLLGDHRYDDKLNDLSAEGIASAVSIRKAYLDSLKAIKVEKLVPENRVDYDILRTNLESDIFTLEQLQPWKSNPMMYNPSNAIFMLVSREFAPFEQRMKSVVGRLTAIPKYVENAKKNLVNPPSIMTETAIQQNVGTVEFIRTTLQTFIDKAPADLKRELDYRQDEAVVALESYGKWLKEDLLPRSKGDFRLGAELYRKKLAYALDTDMTPEQIMERAETDLKQTTDAMVATATEIWDRDMAGKKRPPDTEAGRTQLIREVLAKLSENRPTNETIVEQAKRDLADATEFVKAKNIVTVPSDPVDVIVMPEFQRGVAVAYCDSPGPLEKNGKTFFAISPTPAEWSAERATSFYREYNAYMLKNLVVHEAMPGHYLQLMTGNRFKARTLVRGVFPSGIFAEGWATYTEQVMADAGFGGPEVRMQQLKMRLRLIINAIIDQKIHMAGMTEKEAMDLMMKRGFQEEGEAAGKWRRACLTSAQLSTYYVGNTMMNDVRRRFEADAGSAFVMKTYHDKAISFGTISPRYLPTLLGLPAEGAQTSGSATAQ